MTEPTTGTGPGADDETPEGPVVRDRRRLDPVTGQVRAPSDPVSDPREPQGAPASDTPDDAQRLAEERLADLQRLQAEYVNYRRRVDRDRDVARDAAVSGVLEALLPVLDDVHLARQHGDLLEGSPFAAIVDKLESVLTRLGLVRYGEIGEPFDPAVHDALLHSTSPDAESTTVAQVLQPGYRSGDRVLRPARVAVAGPE